MVDSHPDHSVDAWSRATNTEHGDGLPERRALVRVGTEVALISGGRFLTSRTESFVCVCGHWSTVHRDGGKKTCSQTLCGCYTFRQLSSQSLADEYGSRFPAKLPSCPACGAAIVSKLVVAGMDLRTEWRHLKGDSCMTTETVKIDEEAAERFRRATQAAQDEYQNYPDDYPDEDEWIEPTPSLVPEPPKPVLEGRAPRPQEGEEV